MGHAQDAYHGLKVGMLTAMCYPKAGYPQLRVCNDFLTYLFHLDNLSDEMDQHGTAKCGDIVMNTLCYAQNFPSHRVAKMTKE